MIKIITEELDITSDLIIEWIISLSHKVERKNVEDFQDFILEINNSSIMGLLENTFHRRAKINTIPSSLYNFPYRNEIKTDDNLILKAYEKISKAKGNYIGEFNDEEQHNKILDLYYAKEAGFDIPDTLDFRIATAESPKRYTPFCLPEIIEKRIQLFFKIKNINTGSIDLMVDSKNIFYFLENNSQGQFHWVSFYCNYNIEKHIALDLIQNEKTI
ncbi:ATP-grasp domain-containing protein [Chryseobacterium daeguense]|uniref:hypothetical protein n=1 Tax=Chryseobacterium daeguense TaxID=412438 RepID=UPI000428F5D9|nr:hypothetical protein [Chryseobacterium daeguense]